MISALAIFLLSGCKDNAICEAGSTQLCMCSTDTYGVQICDIDGEHWGTCDCTERNQRVVPEENGVSGFTSDTDTGPEMVSGTASESKDTAEK